jgi:hypothetical protein
MYALRLIILNITPGRLRSYASSWVTTTTIDIL